MALLNGCDEFLTADLTAIISSALRVSPIKLTSEALFSVIVPVLSKTIVLTAASFSII